MKERWKPYPRHPSYWVSTRGRVWSERRCLVVRPQDSAGGYLKITLRCQGERKDRNMLLHRLVLETFRGPCPIGKEAAHLNGTRTDNRLENLRWVSRKENHRHKKAHGTWQGGEANGNNKWSKELVGVAKRMLRKKFTQGQIQELTGLPLHVVKDLRRGRTWKHVGVRDAAKD